ncbi:MAG: nucleoside recognition domain-containing protein [Bacteroidota bacterium]
MNSLVTVILPAGRAAIELSLFVLLPIMVVMLSIMRLLEARGVMDWLVARLAPLLRPFGLTGLGVFAALQVNFVSFAAPLATLSMMESRGASDRHLAAAFAMVLAMAQANATFPMAALGLNIGPVLLWSLVGGLVAAAATTYGFGRSLSDADHVMDETLRHPVAETTKGVLDVINRAGGEAFKIAIGAIPMLVLALVSITALRQMGALDMLIRLLSPALLLAGIDPAVILPTLTKYLAGGTAMMGVVDEQVRQGVMPARLLNASAGFLIHPMDLPGIAILMSAGRRVAAVWRPACLGACVGIAVRTLGHVLVG